MDWGFMEALKPIKKISFTYRGAIQYVLVNNIDVFHSQDKYTMLISKDNESVITDSLRSMEDRLPDFIRIHRNALVRKSMIKKIVRGKVDGVVKHYIDIHGKKYIISRSRLGHARRALLEGSQKQKAFA